MAKSQPGLPFERSALAKFLETRIEELKGVKTQREIAREIGYEKPNILSMFKRGDSKVPLDRIPGMARALGADPVHLLRLAIEQSWPELKEALQAVFAGAQLASEHEFAILLGKWRAATGDSDPGPNARFAAAVDKMLEELFGPKPRSA